MHKITFECETITPMFLAGADGRTPEFRAPSIKGAMRFWWRAIHGHLDLNRLREKEAKIFGGDGEGKGKSLFTIRIGSPLYYKDNYRYSPVPHRLQNNFPQPAFKAGEEFTIILSLTKHALSKLKHETNCTLDYIKNIFLAMTLLGGIGRRTRRGFGSIKVNRIDGETVDIDYTLEFILSLLNNIVRQNFKIYDDKIIRNIKAHLNAKYPFIETIEVGNGSESMDEILTKIGQASHDHRNNSLGFAMNSGRLASPIYVSVIKIENKFFPVVTTLKTVFENPNWTVNLQKQQEFIREVL